MRALPASAAWNRLGLALAALLLLLPLLTLWNLAAQSFAPKLVVIIGPRLSGVTETSPPPEWHLRAFADGNLQKALTRAITGFGTSRIRPCNSSSGSPIVPRPP